LSFGKKHHRTKLKKFLNTYAAEGGQADNDFPEMKLFSKEKGLGNQFREVFQLELVQLIISQPHFHSKSCASIKKIPKTLGNSEISKIFILQR
jgi:hypothetical protein